jgi:hypothetical protein
MGLVVNATARAQEAGWGPGPIWTFVEKRKSLALTEVRTPNHPAISESLYRLLYPGSDPEDGGSIFIRSVDNQHEATRSYSNIEYHNKNFTAMKISSLTSFPYRLRQSDDDDDDDDNGPCVTIACSILTYSWNQYDEKWIWRSLLVYLRRDVGVAGEG